MIRHSLSLACQCGTYRLNVYTTLSTAFVLEQVSSWSTSECSALEASVMVGNVLHQSIRIYFLSNRNITVYTVYASAQKAAREAYAH